MILNAGPSYHLLLLDALQQLKWKIKSSNQTNQLPIFITSHYPHWQLVSNFKFFNNSILLEPRISLSTLQSTKSQGGLEAPNFLHYFLSNRLQYLFKWIHKDNYSTPWLQIEQNQCKTTSLTDIPFLPQSIKKQDYYKNITISSTLTAWWKAHKITKSSLAPCRFTPIWYNPDFQLYNTSVHFPSWHQKGITHLHHLFENNQFISFNTLIQRYGVGRDQFLQYQQLKSIIKSKINITNNTLQPSKLSEDILKITNPKRIISKIYKLLSLTDTSITLPTSKWEKDLALSLYCYH